VHQCPGYWDRGFAWHAGSMWPEQAQVADFLVRLQAKSQGSRQGGVEDARA